MSKWVKRLLGVAAIGSAAAGLFYFLKKSDSDAEDCFDDEFEDEDFDLDNDLKPAVDREYVSLNPQSNVEEAVEEVSGEEVTEETAAEEKEEAAAEAEETVAE